MSNIKKKISIFLIIFLFLVESNAAIKDSLFATVADKAITRSDIIREIKIILILGGQSYDESKKDQIDSTAIQSVINRKIKLSCSGINCKSIGSCCTSSRISYFNSIITGNSCNKNLICSI